MTVDIQESLLTQLYTTLTGDSTLQTAMGGSVSLYPVWAKPDAAFPYLVHRSDLRASSPFPARLGTYLLDIWSDSPSAEEVLDIRKRVVELLDKLTFNTTEVKNVEIQLQTDGFIPETEQDIFHYSMQFNLSLWRQSETVVIINR